MHLHAVTARPASLASESPATPRGDAGEQFEGTRQYVLGRIDESIPLVQRAIELLSDPIPGGDLQPFSPLTRRLEGIVGATMGAANLMQETMLWYGDLRAHADLPEQQAIRERAVLAHVMTAAQGLVRADGFIRAMLEMYRAPESGTDLWRGQALADAADAVTFLQETRSLVEALAVRR